MLTNVLLAKATHMANPESMWEGITQGCEHQEMCFIGVAATVSLPYQAMSQSWSFPVSFLSTFQYIGSSLLLFLDSVLLQLFSALWLLFWGCEGGNFTSWSVLILISCFLLAVSLYKWDCLHLCFSRTELMVNSGALSSDCTVKSF